MANVPGIVLATIIAVVAVIACTLIGIFHEGDNTSIFTTIGGLAALAIPAVLNLKQSTANNLVQQETNKDVKVLDAKVEHAVEKVETIDGKADDLGNKADQTHLVFNGASHEWKQAIEQIAELKAQLASLMGQKEGIEIGRKQVVDDLATTLPAVATTIAPLVSAVAPAVSAATPTDESKS